MSSIDADSFVSLCEKLRKLGAVKVEGHGFSAFFGPELRPGVPSPAGLAQAVAQKRASKQKGEGASEEALREAAYARELGRAV